MKLKRIGALAISVLFGAGMFASLWWAVGVTAHAQPQSTGSSPFIPPDDPSLPNAPADCSIPGTKEGVDVSRFQGAINWADVAAAGKSFAYARVADGATVTDSSFITYYIGIKNAGMKAGGYLSFRPAQDPVLQANLFMTKLLQAGFAPGDLAPAIYVARTDGQISPTFASNLATVVNTISRTLHVMPVIATGPSFFDSVNVSPTLFGGDPLWTIHYTNGCPGIPAGWITWTIWMYTSTGTVQGITGVVDLDRTNGPNLPVYLAIRAYLPIVLADTM